MLVENGDEMHNLAEPKKLPLGVDVGAVSIDGHQFSSPSPSTLEECEVVSRPLLCNQGGRPLSQPEIDLSNFARTSLLGLHAH